MNLNLTSFSIRKTLRNWSLIKKNWLNNHQKMFWSSKYCWNNQTQICILFLSAKGESITEIWKDGILWCTSNKELRIYAIIYQFHLGFILKIKLENLETIIETGFSQSTRMVILMASRGKAKAMMRNNLKKRMRANG
jgi:hypothetical protein